LPDERQIRTLVERFYSDAWNRWDDGAVDEILTADFVFRGSLGDQARGRDGFRAYRDKVRSAFPDFRNEVREIIAERDRAAVRLRRSGRHGGELFGLCGDRAERRLRRGRVLACVRRAACEARVLGDLEHLRSQLSPRAGT
jgi:predicted ester cyclase